MPRVELAGLGPCPTCGKNRYLTRQYARKIVRLYPQLRKRAEKGRLSAYPCGRYWHVGHLDDNVRKGETTRGALYNR